MAGAATIVDEAAKVTQYERIYDSWVTLFEGAVEGNWVAAVRRAYSGAETQEDEEDEDGDRLQVTGSGAGSRSRSEVDDEVDDEERKRIKVA